AERHPHERARARPRDQVIRGGDQKTFVREFVIEPDEECIVGADRPARARIEDTRGGRRDDRGALWRQSHSSAPLRHSYIKPMVSTPRKTIIDQKPKRPSSPKATAHGNRKLTSRSKMMKRMATR